MPVNTPRTHLLAATIQAMTRVTTLALACRRAVETLELARAHLELGRPVADMPLASAALTDLAHHTTALARYAGEIDALSRLGETS